MARTEKVKGKCTDCAERKHDENGKLYCPPLKCVFTDSDLEFYREVGGATLIDPSEGDH